MLKVAVWDMNYDGEDMGYQQSENALNEWIEDERPDIKFIHQSIGEGNLVVLTIWYEESVNE